MSFGPQLCASALRARRNCEHLSRKLTQTHSDIAFLGACKRLNLVPKGLQLKNPLRSTSSSSRSKDICFKASQLLRNLAISEAYKKQRTLCNKLSSAKSELSSELPSHVNKDQVFNFLDNREILNKRRCFARKERKLQTLFNKSPVLSRLHAKDYIRTKAVFRL
ncbi:hypothetical protein HOLleu_25390 [Holothuria leucospilota]|uniref:Uncharacterized protein n=1 Tax=Holothuria leucospilota TaxID=206669 RepID=A0A9Q1H4B4_HOLLE|nr:hypothetical protein HOLleu_25390 [Holothuria leucospilota]